MMMLEALLWNFFVLLILTEFYLQFYTYAAPTETMATETKPLEWLFKYVAIQSW